ncbi:hypothetical protein N7535_002404 [Penicillium sp. DV-2018c]|nr:hypothetical protein N7535_002404 [Penicillium sp. DV-2018c]
MYQQIQRIFFVVSFASIQYEGQDPILDLPIVKINKKVELIVGLPSVEGKNQYAVALPAKQNPASLGQDGAYEYLTHCTWNVEFFFRYKLATL